MLRSVQMEPRSTCAHNGALQSHDPAPDEEPWQPLAVPEIEPWAGDRVVLSDECAALLLRACLAYMKEAEARRISRRAFLLRKHNVRIGPVTLRDVWPDSVPLPEWIDAAAPPLEGLLSLIGSPGMAGTVAVEAGTARGQPGVFGAAEAPVADGAACNRGG